MQLMNVDARSGDCVFEAEQVIDRPRDEVFAFFSNPDQLLKKIDVSGGPPVALCEAPDGKGGSWGSQGVILFAPSAASSIHRVAASGGEPEPVTPHREQTPGGRPGGAVPFAHSREPPG